VRHRDRLKQTRILFLGLLLAVGVTANSMSASVSIVWVDLRCPIRPISTSVARSIVMRVITNGRIAASWGNIVFASWDHHSNLDSSRDHHPYAFSMFMAGGGVRGGYIHGETDEPYQGVDMRLTNITRESHVIKELISS